MFGDNVWVGNVCRGVFKRLDRSSLNKKIKMSADNGIYILESPGENGDEYRVISATAIENITYEPNRQGFNIEMLRNYFGRAKVFGNMVEATDEAWRLYNEIMEGPIPVIEYGISKIVLPFPFPKELR